MHNHMWLGSHHVRMRSLLTRRLDDHHVRRSSMLHRRVGCVRYLRVGVLVVLMVVESGDVASRDVLVGVDLMVVHSCGRLGGLVVDEILVDTPKPITKCSKKSYK